MVDLVEACRDVPFEDPLIGAGGEVVDLGNRVLGPTLRAEAVAARLEIRFEDWLQDQLQGSLDDPIPDGRDAEAAALAVRLRDHPLPHGKGLEAPGLEVFSHPGEHCFTE
jgi:hypothetical protein